MRGGQIESGSAAARGGRPCAQRVAGTLICTLHVVAAQPRCVDLSRSAPGNRPTAPPAHLDATDAGRSTSPAGPRPYLLPSLPADRPPGAGAGGPRSAAIPDDVRAGAGAPRSGDPTLAAGVSA